MKKITVFLIALLLVVSCSKEESLDSTDNGFDTQELYSINEVNTFIENQLKEHGDVNWLQAETKMLYSAIMHGGEIVSIGYGSIGESFSKKQKSPQTQGSLQKIIHIVNRIEGISKSGSDIIADDILNVVDLRITQQETVAELQNTSNIRYMDPIGYGFFAQSQNQQKNAGCNRGNDVINSQDVSSISPNALLPWNFDIHNIPQAWELSSGAGITVGVIDTGLSPNQELLNGRINDGDSNGRSVQRFGTYIDSPWWWSNNIDGPDDRCGHGTQMTAVLGSPRNDDSQPVGVAYNANLVVYRGTSDVLLDDYHERKGVSNALKELANRSDVRIISMSIGYPWSIGNIKDAVRYAYSKGKLIIAAGGTSTSITNWYGIIFPASMSETVAVTGIKDNGYKRCSNCHDGDMDFTIVMQRGGDSNRNVPIVGYNTGTTQYAGGSSVATAMTSGIAALVWARNPNLTRDQVLEKLKKAGEFYPNRDGRFGYGNIDALKAVQ